MKARRQAEILSIIQEYDIETQDQLLEKLREVDSLRAERARLEHLLDRRREAAVCPVCGAPARKDDVFCRACGKRL